MRLGYSKKLRSNYLVVEIPAERSLSFIARRADMHSADRRDAAGVIRYAVVFVSSDGFQIGEPALLSRKQLERRGCSE